MTEAELARLFAELTTFKSTIVVETDTGEPTAVCGITGHEMVKRIDSVLELIEMELNATIDF